MKKIAIIGYGGQGAWHAEHALKSDVVSLAGIYDISAARRDAARGRGIHVYSSQEELLSDPQVDIVVCATPNDSHKEIVISALRAKKHVICEKPAALSVRDFDDMCREAEAARRLLTVHQNRRWDVDYLAMRELLRTGEIGDAVNIESRIHGSRGIPSDWRCKAEHGGGMLYDWGVHLIDQILLLIPEKVTHIYCEMTHITTKEVDDGFNLHMTFESGKRATVEVGTYNFLPLPRFYMQASEGTAVIDDWQKNCRVAKLTAWCERDVLPVQTAAGITKTMAPRDSLTLRTYECPRPVSDVHDFYRNFTAATDGKCDMAVSHCEVRRVLSVIEAAIASGESKTALFVNI